MEITEINCKKYGKYNSNYNLFYFNETDEFMLTARTSLSATRISNKDFSVILCDQMIFSQQENENSIIYNNGYKVVNFSNFSNYMTCTNITILNEEEAEKTEQININYSSSYISYNNYSQCPNITILNEEEKETEKTDQINIYYSSSYIS